MGILESKDEVMVKMDGNVKEMPLFFFMRKTSVAKLYKTKKMIVVRFLVKTLIVVSEKLSGKKSIMNFADDEMDYRKNSKKIPKNHKSTKRIF